VSVAWSGARPGLQTTLRSCTRSGMQVVSQCNQADSHSGRKSPSRQVDSHVLSQEDSQAGGQSVIQAGSHVLSQPVRRSVSNSASQTDRKSPSRQSVSHVLSQADSQTGGQSCTQSASRGGRQADSHSSGQSVNQPASQHVGAGSYTARR
jgi:hypothetical protein